VEGRVAGVPAVTDDPLPLTDALADDAALLVSVHGTGSLQNHDATMRETPTAKGREARSPPVTREQRRRRVDILHRHASQRVHVRQHINVNSSTIVQRVGVGVEQGWRVLNGGVIGGVAQESVPSQRVIGDIRVCRACT
jgi:hypothetical protein